MRFFSLINEQFRDRILTADLSEKKLLERFAYRLVQVLYSISRDVLKGQLSLQAMSLVYTTLITLVPLLALSFSVLKGFGVHNQIEPFLLNLLAPMGEQGTEIANQIIGFVDNIKVGVLGALGLGLLVYSVIALMQKIERAFNAIWHVERARTLAQRFSDYLSVLLIWPLFIFVSAGLTTSVRSHEIIPALGLYGVSEYIVGFFGVIIPYIIMALAFTFIFIFMPNRKIRFLPAFMGGLFSAFAWKLMGFIFSAVLLNSSSYVAIYAAFATLILFIIWIYLGWLVVLIGSSLAFYIQNPSYTATPREGITLSIEAKEKLSLQILCLIGRSFYKKNKTDWDAVTISRLSKVPVPIIIELLKSLERTGLIIKTCDFAMTYVPGVGLEDLSLYEALELIRQDGYNIAPLPDTKLSKKLEKLAKEVESANKFLKEKKIKDFIV